MSRDCFLLIEYVGTQLSFLLKEKKSSFRFFCVCSCSACFVLFSVILPRGADA